MTRIQRHRIGTAVLATATQAMVDEAAIDAVAAQPTVVAAAAAAVDANPTIATHTVAITTLQSDVVIVGPADDLAAALATATNIQLEEGVYTVPLGHTIGQSGVTITGRGPGKTILRGAAGNSFEYMLYGTGLTNITIRDLTIDANYQNRTVGLDNTGQRACGLGLVDCDDVLVHNVISMNARGNGSVPGVCFGLTGTNVTARDCVARNGGEIGKAADGFFTGGDYVSIENCLAINCLDTGFVLENSNYGSIDGVAIDCSAAGAISCFGASHYRGNVIKRLQALDWSASVTGGVQIGVFGTGNLYDTKIGGLVMVQTDPATVGSAVVCRQTSTGIIDGLTFDQPQITGADKFGMEIEANNVTINQPQIRNVNQGGAGASCIVVQTGSTNVRVNQPQLVGGNANFVIIVETGCDDVVIDTPTIDGSGVASWGIYYFGTTTNAMVLWARVQNTTFGTVGGEAGTTGTWIKKDL